MPDVFIHSFSLTLRLALEGKELTLMGCRYSICDHKMCSSTVVFIQGMYSTAICYNSLILQILYRVILKPKRRVLTNFYRLEQNLLMLIIMLLMKSKKR